MAYQGIGTGTTPNDNSGDSLLVGAVKVNSNFQEVYNALGDGTNIVLTKNRSINTGAGLTGGGNLNSDRTLSVLTGSGVTISQGLVGVDTSVIRTTGNQRIVGVLTATSFVRSGGTSSQFLKADGSVDSSTYLTSASVPGAANNGQLTLQTSGIGLTGSQTFTANQSGNVTFTITSNATPSGTTSGTIVSRGLNGDFSAGSITATSFIISGGTSSQVLKADGSVGIVTSANNGQLTLQTSGIGLTGSQTFTANQSSNATFTVTSNATSSNTASTLVSRDSSGNFSAGSITATSFIKSGGTSSQFLKADGSVDSNTYLTSAGTGGVPIGGIIMWSGSIATIPTGWSLCNGANGTPDLRDRFIVGAGSAYNPGNTGGSNSVTLTENQIPSHKHTFSMDNERVSGGSGAVVADIRNGGSPTDSGSLSLYRGQETGNTGGGGSHENRPPYYALAFIMRTS